MSAVQVPRAGCARRRAKAVVRRENVRASVERIEDAAFFERGAIPASAAAVTICPCGYRSFSRDPHGDIDLHECELS